VELVLLHFCERFSPFFAAVLAIPLLEPNTNEGIIARAADPREWMPAILGCGAPAGRDIAALSREAALSVIPLGGGAGDAAPAATPTALDARRQLFSTMPPYANEITAAVRRALAEAALHVPSPPPGGAAVAGAAGSKRARDDDATPPEPPRASGSSGKHPRLTLSGTKARMTPASSTIEPLSGDEAAPTGAPSAAVPAPAAVVHAPRTPPHFDTAALDDDENEGALFARGSSSELDASPARRRSRAQSGGESDGGASTAAALGETYDVSDAASTTATSRGDMSAAMALFRTSGVWKPDAESLLRDVEAAASAAAAAAPDESAPRDAGAVASAFSDLAALAALHTSLFDNGAPFCTPSASSVSPACLWVRLGMAGVPGDEGPSPPLIEPAHLPRATLSHIAWLLQCALAAVMH
jgi:hypothetical protein